MRATLGLFGGTFDPIHMGHIRIAGASVTQLSLDALRLIPCGAPTHRNTPDASAQHRVAMIESALAEIASPKITLDTREVTSPKPNYTHTTLTALRRENPDTALIWLTGEDAFLGLATWYRWEALFDLAHFVVFARNENSALPSPLRKIMSAREIHDPQELAAARAGMIYRMKLPPYPVSSTEIRAALKNHDRLSLEHLLPKSVLAYIVEHRLYL